MILIFMSLLHLSLGSEFVRRDGHQLRLGEEEFTFSGVNIYWLGQVMKKTKLAKPVLAQKRKTCSDIGIVDDCVGMKLPVKLNKFFNF